MRSNNRLLTATLLAIGLTLGGGAAHAGTADMVTSDGHEMKFEYLGDDLLRINMQEDNYMLVQGGEVYMVTNSDGELMVINLKQAMGMFGSMADSATPSAVEGKLVSLKSLGRKETVAGIPGEVYEVRFLDQEGQERTAEVVLSGDPRAVELQQAMFNMAKSMAKAANREVKGQEEIKRKLDGMNMGILRYGDDMRVTAISDTTFDKGHFALPAEPTDLSGLQGVFGGGQAGDDQGQSGGMMSGILGAFGQQEQEGSEEQQEESAEGGTESIKKAFGKLFGK